MKLREIARASVQDAGMLAEVAVVAFDARDYPLLEQMLTPARIRIQLGRRVRPTIVRYSKPHLGALTFVLWPTRSSTHAFSSILLQMDLETAPSRLQLVG